MRNWTWQRKTSFFVHAGFVAIPLGLSTGAALIFWHDLFGLWGIAALMVCTVEVLAFAGLVLSIARIPSPFVWLRHALPFISVVPLGREFYVLLEHNDPWVAGFVTIVAVAILVGVAWACYAEIERQFIDPIDAARERAQAQFDVLRVTLAQLEVMDHAADAFVVDRLQYHAPRLTAARPQETYPEPELTTLQPANRNAPKLYICKKCKVEGFTFDELGRHSRGCKEEIV